MKKALSGILITTIRKLPNNMIKISINMTNPRNGKGIVTSMKIPERGIHKSITMKNLRHGRVMSTIL